MSKPLILVTNDDGITSIGIRLLVEIASKFGEVVVVAPDKPQSGMGHAITVALPLFLKKSSVFDDLKIKAFSCSGTPADCVKLARNVVLKNKAPDLVLSGINHGSNASISVLYSGTMSAAIEAALEGIPSIGFSYCDYDYDQRMDHVSPHIEKIIAEAIKNKVPSNVALNVNIPATKEKIKGIKICRQARTRWKEEFEKKENPFGVEYYWLAGEFLNEDKGEDTDDWAIANNYISIVPCRYDLTAYNAISDLNKDWDI